MRDPLTLVTWCLEKTLALLPGFHRYSDHWFVRLIDLTLWAILIIVVLRYFLKG